MRLPSTLPVLIAVSGFALLAAAVVNNVSFMHRATGVMTADAASSIGLTNANGPWVKRVWFAPDGHGSYEVRTAAPFIGVVPFTSTTSAQDLQASCKRLRSTCKAV